MLAQAVQELFPDAKLGIGPPIENGFYYDFDVAEPFKPEDLEKIETRMRKIIKEGQRFARRVGQRRRGARRARRRALQARADRAQGRRPTARPPKGARVEVGAGELTIYDNLRRNGELAWKDLCRGPHLPTTKRIPAFKLMRSAAAYWRGSEKNPQLQRIYGTAWESKEALEAHLHRLEEAERRDHRKLGRELDLFSFPDEIGSGLAGLPPQGRRAQARDGGLRPAAAHRGGLRVRRHPAHHARRGCSTPPATCRTTRTRMFPPMELEGSSYHLKAMNCPMHNLIYRSRGRSYRELPLRLFEFGSVYRYEKSGVVHGLTRVRGMTQDDSHSYVTPEQAPDEIKHLLDFVLGLLRDFGLDDFYLELSTRDDATRTSSSAPTRSGRPPPRSSSRRPPRPASSSSPTRAARRTTARRSRCRPATRSAAPGRCRRSSTTSTSRPASAWSTSPPTARGSSR